ncbi:hypothetical protein, partial [Leuconostoc mesenteroides]|uniref:hypothetical protein n=1 Tax=Leuconostoc mesenteroides TaxID=1245 RepID=UPI0023618287
PTLPDDEPPLSLDELDPPFPDDEPPLSSGSVEPLSLSSPGVGVGVSVPLLSLDEFELPLSDDELEPVSPPG